jgi:hypothetical protein
VGTAITGIDLKAKAFLTFPDIFLDKWRGDGGILVRSDRRTSLSVN